MIYYYLHVVGTDRFDCKFIFSTKQKLDKYLQQLLLNEVTVDKRFLADNEEDVYRYETHKLDADDAMNWWESKIIITAFYPERFKTWHKYFKAPFWDEMPQQYRRRIYA